MAMYDTLDKVRADIATRLQEAASDRRSPMHAPVVATGDADARVMVLRAFDADSWTLRFHTDARAPKVAVIEADSRIAVLGYDKPAKVQLRMRGTGRIERVGPAVDAAWAESTNFARRCYLGEGPGTPSALPTSGLPEEFEGFEPDDGQLLPARGNFAILLIEVAEIDWFSLAHTGHRRALLTRDRGRWISP
ncbi:MAG: pyridoxamine 5'-phosphate oxidase family protein [Erythrobacter sp.]